MVFEKLRHRHNEHLSDEDITAKIREALHSYGPLESTHPLIRVEVLNGDVVLGGAVRGAGQRDMAGKLAATVDGVKTVRNELRDDPTLEGVVARELATHPLLRLSTTRIKIRSFNGVVSLRGPVLNQVQQMTAEAVACRVPGVEQVVNQLRIVPDGNGYHQ